MERIDLHTHTLASDGSDTPARGTTWSCRVTGRSAAMA